MLPMGAVRDAWEAMPKVTLVELLRGRVPCILVPHPSDGVLGCGGLIAQCNAAGITPEIVILTDGSHSHPNSREYPPERLRAIREEESRRSLRLLGLPSGHTWFLGHEDQEDLPVAGPGFQLAARRLSGICESQGCTLLIAPWRADGHADHEATATLAEHVALRDELDLIFYPLDCWSLNDDALVEAEMPQGWRLDIAAEAALKQQAVMVHETQYGGLITDDSESRPCEKQLAACCRPVEIYLAA